MKKLYTLNGVYPDQDFNFVVEGSDLGLVSSSHTHDQLTILDDEGLYLESVLSGKAAANHEHTDYLNSINIGDDKVTGTIDFSVSGEITQTTNGTTVEIGRIAVINPAVPVTGYVNENINQYSGVDVTLDPTMDAIGDAQLLSFGTETYNP